MDNTTPFTSGFPLHIGVKMWATKYWMLFGQLLFMTFVLATVKSNLTEINCKSTLKSDFNENKASH